MATYKEIREYVQLNFGYKPKTCWIAHAEEIIGLSPKNSPNRKDLDKRVQPCPK